MSGELILLVDNNVDYVKTLAEYIEQADYRVVKAYSAEDARNYAGQLHPDLAVIDVRLVNDDDEGDRTGVFLAKTLRETCPVIMLTNHATYELVRQTLKLDEDDRSLAVDFMDKHEGPAELIQTVQRVLAKPGRRGANQRSTSSGSGVSKAKMITTIGANGPSIGGILKRMTMVELMAANRKASQARCCVR